LLQATRRIATLLTNGKVLSVGGSDAELYIPLARLHFHRLGKMHRLSRSGRNRDFVPVLDIVRDNAGL
jgi:hypothetical protein